MTSNEWVLLNCQDKTKRMDYSIFIHSISFCDSFHSLFIRCRVSHLVGCSLLANHTLSLIVVIQVFVIILSRFNVINLVLSVMAPNFSRLTERTDVKIALAASAALSAWYIRNSLKSRWGRSNFPQTYLLIDMITNKVSVNSLKYRAL